MGIDFKRELNERQCEACTSGAKHLRIIAGAGTGKTRVLTYRIAYMISALGVVPQRLVAITFTKKAANELLTRTKSLLAQAGVETRFTPWVSTFHSFCNMILRHEAGRIPGYTTKFTIADGDDQARIVNSVAESMGFKSDKEKVKYLAGRIRALKSKAIFPEEAPDGEISLGKPLSDFQVKKGYIQYQDALQKNCCFDFDDLLLFTYRLLKEFPDIRERWCGHYDAYLIDEFQDTDPLQYKLVQLLLRDDSYLSVVGDPDQTIYSWRGAESDLITRQLKRDFKDLETITLDVNYRSTQNILDRANKLIRNNSDRLEKSLVADSGERGEEVSCSFFDSRQAEASAVVNRIIDLSTQGYKYSDIAIIYRSNYLSSDLEKSLAQNRIPYDIYGGLKFYERAEIKDALAYLRLLVNPSDSFSFWRAINAPKIGIGDVGRANITKAAQRDECSEFQEAMRNYDRLGLTSGAASRLKSMKEAYDACREDLAKEKTGQEYNDTLFKYLDAVGLIAHVTKQDRLDDKNSFDTNSKNTRLNNVQELLHQIRVFIDADHFDDEGNPVTPALEDFLIDIALQSDADSMTSADKVLLMTGHVSKGLEFPVVFVTGMNDGIFPTRHALDGGQKSIEEERRLFYVAITRAKKRLFISSPGGYGFSYESGPQLPSMFLQEIGFERKRGNYPYVAPAPTPRISGFYSGTRSTKYSINRPAQPDVEKLQQGADMLLNTRTTSLKPKSVTIYAPGDRIAHVSFGVGEITAVGPTTITVKFDEPYGVKTLSKSFTRAFRKV